MLYILLTFGWWLVLIFSPDVYVDGLGAERSEWVAEEREGRLEQVDSGTESADDR